jgi:hypothetical protein
MSDDHLRGFFERGGGVSRFSYLTVIVIFFETTGGLNG